MSNWKIKKKPYNKEAVNFHYLQKSKRSSARNVRKITTIVIEFGRPNEVEGGGMSKSLSEKKRVNTISFRLGVNNETLNKMILEMMELKNIIVKPKMGIVFDSSKLFNISEIKLDSLWRWKSCVNTRWSKSVLRLNVNLFRKYSEFRGK